MRLTPKLRVVNVIATSQVGQQVNLVRVGEHPSGSYDGNSYRGQVAYIKTMKMKGRVSVFSNGKLICAGTRSKREAQANIRAACGVLADVGVKVPDNPEAKVQNVVATGELGKPINLERLASRPNVMYEPEQFPAAIFHPKELDGGSVLVFANGKVVFSGLRGKGLLDTAKRILEKLADYS